MQKVNKDLTREGTTIEKWYWFNTYTYSLMDFSEAMPEYYINDEMIQVKRGTVIKIFISIERGTEHVVVGGRALFEDREQGLFSLSDFDEDNYILAYELAVSEEQKKKGFTIENVLSFASCPKLASILEANIKHRADAVKIEFEYLE